MTFPELRFKKLIAALCFLMAFSNQSFAQLEFSKWYFGYNSGLDFSTTPPTIVNSAPSGGSLDAAVICDPTGNMLFMVTAGTIYNSSFSPMANGSSLSNSLSSTQNCLVAKQPGSNSKYYIFTIVGGGVSTSPNAGFFYSIVDMSLAAGLGSVTVLNNTVCVPTCAKQVLVRHCNGKDVWIVIHEYNSNNFRSYLLTATGLNTVSPVVSSIGETIGGTGTSASNGYMAISPDSKKLASTTYSSSTTPYTGQGGVHLFDFDAATGIVSNSITLINQNRMGGVEFSPDGSKLYASKSPSISSGTGELYQWNVCANGSTAAILASQYSVTLPGYTPGTITRAINGKLYVSSVASGPVYSLSVINNPNLSGAAMNFSLNAQNLGTGHTGGLVTRPVNEYVRQAPIVFASTVNCQNVNFAPVLPTSLLGCSATPYPPGSYSWNFGDPASGSANTSTLTNPQHNYPVGTYTASLIMYNPCGNDTVNKIINISSPDPSITVSGQFTVCNGDRRPYTASGGNTYNWSNNGSGATVNLTPSVTTVYNVTTTTTAGCTGNKSFTIVVNPCVGLSGIESTVPARIYPNPFNDALMLDSSTDGDIEISTLEGRLIYKAKITEGQNQLNTSELSKGVYILKLSSKAGEWRGKVVKGE